MFWRKKKQPPLREPKEETQPEEKAQKTESERLEEAVEKLADSLSAYSDAAYRASQKQPDEELVSAYEKVDAARKLVTQGRLAYALGRCIPEHVKYWASWIDRENFDRNVGFDASEITAVRSKEQDGSRSVQVETINFKFNDRSYMFILRDRGYSYAPDSTDKLGEVELWLAEELVAKFEIIEDISKEYSEWGFHDVCALKVGPWMKDVLDIATQIESHRKKWMDSFVEERVLSAAKNVELE